MKRISTDRKLYREKVTAERPLREISGTCLGVLYERHMAEIQRSTGVNGRRRWMLSLMASIRVVPPSLSVPLWDEGLFIFPENKESSK